MTERKMRSIMVYTNSAVLSGMLADFTEIDDSMQLPADVYLRISTKKITGTYRK